MSAYVLFQFDFTNQEIAQAYGQKSGPSIAAYNGEVVLPPTAQATLEGDPPRSQAVLVKFDSEETARAWYNSAEYEEAHKVRDGEMNMIITMLGEG